MEKNLKDYIHLYKDAKIVHEKYPDTQMSVHNWDKSGYVVMGKSDEFQELKPHHKLILRPLSDMTEEEKSWLGWDKEVIDYTINELNYKTWYWHTDEFHYLLKKGFDLFGLIESGLAIDKTTINNT